MKTTDLQRLWRALLYGGGAVLLLTNIYLLAKSVVVGNFVPVLPILVGILTAGGLLIIVYSEHRAREEDKKDHRRISRVANQLESPLNALQADVAQLVKKADGLPADDRMTLKKMETKSKVLLENIRDVFLTLRAQEGKVSQEIRTYDMCALVKEAIEQSQPLASARNVEIVQKMHCQDAPVKVDRRLAIIVLMHMIENALLYTMTPGLVNVAVVKGKKFVRVVVQDRGIGVKEADKEIIFKPFARGKNAEQYDPDGIGVGLTLSQLIAKEFGGKIIWQQRKPNMGTQFEFELPLANIGK